VGLDSGVGLPATRGQSGLDGGIHCSEVTHEGFHKKGDYFMGYHFSKTCNLAFDDAVSKAYQALQAEDKVGTMLPCNVIIQAQDGGKVEVSAVDPVASMMAIENPALAAIAGQVRSKLKKVIESL
jgi:hypothetical protein